MLIFKQSLRVAIGGAFVAALYRYTHLDQNLIYYPLFGYLSVMTPTFSGAIQAGWAQLAGALLGGVVAALALTSLGNNPIIASLSYIVTMLLCEMLQWKAFLTATMLFPLLFIDKAHGQYPWHYVYDRVRYVFIGVSIGMVIMACFWRDKPRVTLSNKLVQILHNSDQAFETIVSSHLRGELPSAEIEEHLSQMQKLIQESQSLLDESTYGIAGDLFIKDNWSQLIAAQWRLRRYLSLMRQPSSLWQQFTVPLTDLIEQVSSVCTTLTYLVPSRSAPQPQHDIPLITRDVSEITQQLRQLSTTPEFQAIPLSDILNFYAFLHALSQFTQELEQLAQHLQVRQAGTEKKRAIGLSFNLHPLQGDTVKKYLKGALVLGIVSALGSYFDLFGIKQWAIIFALVAMILIQPLWGTTLSTARTIIICFIITYPICYLLMKTLGTSAVSIAIVLFAISYLCLSLKLIAGFQLSVKNASVILLLVPANSPTLYTQLWDILKNSFAGILLALLISRLFWPTYSTQQAEPSISQTLIKMGQIYQTLIDKYLQGVDNSELTEPFYQSIQQAIQSQVSLQAFTAQEILDNEMVSQTHHRWNFLISYEKKLLSNLLSLQDAICSDNSSSVAQVLLLELQGLARSTAQAFKDLGAAVGSYPRQKEFTELLAAIDAVRQRLEHLRIQRASSDFSLDAFITFSSILLIMKEIASDLNQMAQDWPSSNPARI